MRGVMRGRHAGIVLALLAAACDGPARDSASPAPCPRVAVLAEGAELVRGGAVARITGVEARCGWHDPGRRVIEARIAPRLAVAPLTEGAPALDLPWFVAMTDAGDATVLEHVAATTRLPPGMEATAPAARLLVPVARGLSADNYLIRVSFQLSPEELARARGGVTR